MQFPESTVASRWSCERPSLHSAEDLKAHSDITAIKPPGSACAQQTSLQIRGYPARSLRWLRWLDPLHTTDHCRKLINLIPSHVPMRNHNAHMLETCKKLSRLDPLLLSPKASLQRAVSLGGCQRLDLSEVNTAKFQDRSHNWLRMLHQRTWSVR